MALEFKIGRLRFSWAGAWTPAVVYARDSVVSYQGKTYACVTPNTATSNFYDDSEYWDLILDGKTFAGTWETGTFYAVSNIVIYGGAAYQCTVQHDSTDFGVDYNTNDYWTIYAEFTNWYADWETDTFYGLNSVVKYGANVYKCISAHTSASTASLGLEDSFENWELFYSGVEYTGDWAADTRYKLNDLVKVNAGIYKCTAYHQSGSTFADTNWDTFIVGQGFELIWNSATEYQIGDVVVYGGNAYISQTTANLNILPSAETFDWELFNQGYSIRGEWNSGTTYPIGSVVRRHGILFEAIDDSVGQDPSTGTVTTAFVSVGATPNRIVLASVDGIAPGMQVSGVGVNFGQYVSEVGTGYVILDREPNRTLVADQLLLFTGVTLTKWKVLVPGIRWTGLWISGTTYVPGDIAVYRNGSYRCTQTHVAELANRPDQVPGGGGGGTYWALIVSHNKTNAMTTPGDMETVINAVQQPFAIGPQGYALRTAGSLPNWAQLNLVPNIYYVDATQGTDRADFGRTWDQPWQSIRYSCDFIGQGLYFADATELLEINKGWMITEMYQWMLYQMANSVSPFTPDSLWNAEYTQRDAAYIVDAVIYDMRRGGNSQSVAAALKFFYVGLDDVLVSSLVKSTIDFITASLVKLAELMQNVITNTAPATDYQALNGVSDIEYVDQIINQSLVLESGAELEVGSLMDIIIDALTLQNASAVPQPNTGITAILNIKTDTYNERLPIVVPENVSLNGDELRSVVVQPATSVLIYCTQTVAVANTVIVNSTAGLEDQMPMQFISPYVNNASTTFGGVVSGQTYYINGASITSNSFKLRASPTFTFTGTTIVDSNILTNVDRVSNLAIGANISGVGVPGGATVVAFSQELSGIATIEISAPATATVIGSTLTATGAEVSLTSGSGTMQIYAGDSLKDMFYLRNGTTMRNMSLFGLVGTLTAQNEYGLARPTGGSYTSLDPGKGPDDTSAWIHRRSPYVQNITTFGTGCVGFKIDGLLHSGGQKSMVANDFTHVLSDGIGVWCTGARAITECVSVFSYYNYIGHFAENGGRIRSTNGNSSYGTFGAVSEGFDDSEVPITGTVYNRSSQVQASVQNSFGTAANLLKLEFNNAGSGYFHPTTNMLNYSNNFVATWATDGNITFIKNEVAPTGYTEAWLITGTKSTPGTGYVYQNMGINSAGFAYTSLAATNVTGSGSGARFNVSVTSTSYVVTVATAGSLYSVTNQLTISGSALGGVSGVNDLSITVTALTGSGILSVSSSGTVPTGSNRSYTLSILVYPGTSSTVDLQGIFSGTSILTSGITYNVESNVVTPYGSGGGAVPIHYGAQKTLTPGWYRIWLSTYDVSGVNNNLQFRFFPQGASNPVANTYSVFYAAQAEISPDLFEPDFYLETNGTRYTSYANYQVVGAGSGAVLLGDETRSGSVFNARLTADSNLITGGSGYVTANNNAQIGDPTYIQIAQSEQGLVNYVGMRIFINSGTGAGQYGYISSYNNSTKIIQVLQESVDAIPIIESSSTGNLLSITPGTDLSRLYVDQAVQFVPTYYTTTVSQTSTSAVTATEAVGGTTNTITVSSTASLQLNMPIQFSGTTFSTVTPGYSYYIVNIIDSVTIQISNQPFGIVWQLSSATGSMSMTYPNYYGYLTAASTANMLVNIPIQFTGSSLGGVELGEIYYINDIININTFTISNLLIELEATSSSDVTNAIGMDATASLIPLNPVVFGGTMFDANIDAGTKYYISNIVDGNNFNITETILNITCTSTLITSNLITCTSTTGFVIDQPIRFIGLTFGGIVAETVYFIQTINNSTSFTISSTPGGSAVPLASASGAMTARTCPTPKVLAGGTGTVTLTTTGTKRLVTTTSGSMNATFSTSVFGGLVGTTIYYITAINSGANPTITVSESIAGSAVSVANGVGAMNMGSVGWDHINPGTPISPSLDPTSQYFIEPRTVFSDPGFSQTAATSVVTLSPGVTWQSIAYGDNQFVAIPSAGLTGATSVDGSTWTTMAFPLTQSWTDVEYGNDFWVAIATGSATAAYSNANGRGWRTSTLPSNTTWNKLAYGNGIFVAVATGTTSAAYSTNYGRTWTAATLPASSSWAGLVYGNGLFVAIGVNGTVAYSTNGATWQQSSATGSSFSSLAFGNNRFVAVQSGTLWKAAYSFDGITWYYSKTDVSATKIVYGQGVFVTVSSLNGTSYTSDSGLWWTTRTVSNSTYTTLGFGFNSSNAGVFPTLAGQNVGSIIKAGVRPQGRATVNSGVMNQVSLWEPGSNFTAEPTINFIDYNVSVLAQVDSRIGDGALGNPTFVNRGLGYNTTSTFISIVGNGYADTFQTGYVLIVNNLSSLPLVGSNLAIAGNDQIYKVTSATAVYGTSAPFIEANVQISPTMTNALSPADGAAVSVRQLYSQCRLTNHDFLSVGVGNIQQTNYPSVNDTGSKPQNEAVEANQGRVFYTSTDQDGNFEVGGLFGVQQATGTVTLSATQFGLSGLSTLSLGGIAVGGSSVVVTQFSTDATFTANSDNIIPTQRAVKSYLTSRLSQGGANTFTGELIAGTVVVGGANYIRSTVPNGYAGSTITVRSGTTNPSQTSMYFKSPEGFSSVGGDMAALDFFMKNGARKSS